MNETTKLVLAQVAEKAALNVPPQNCVKAPHIVGRGRSKRRKLLITVLVSAVGLSAIGILLVSRSVAAPANKKATVAIISVESSEPGTAPSRWRVFAFDDSYLLKPGDTVVVHENGQSHVRQVAATGNEAVLLKRGRTLEGLYMAGEDGYVVISDRDGKIVRGREITATIEPAGEREH